MVIRHCKRKFIRFCYFFHAITSQMLANRVCMVRWSVVCLKLILDVCSCTLQCTAQHWITFGNSLVVCVFSVGQNLPSVPNVVKMPQSTAELKLLLVWENERPPFWNSTSGFNFDPIVVVRLFVCCLFVIVGRGPTYPGPQHWGLLCRPSVLAQEGEGNWLVSVCVSMHVVQHLISLVRLECSEMDSGHNACYIAIRSPNYFLQSNQTKSWK